MSLSHFGSSIENSLFGQVPSFQIGLYGFFESSFLNDLYILDISLLLEVDKLFKQTYKY